MNDCLWNQLAREIDPAFERTYDDELHARYTPIVARLTEAAAAAGYFIPPERPMCCIDCWERHCATSIEHESYWRAFPALFRETATL